MPEKHLIIFMQPNPKTLFAGIHDSTAVLTETLMTIKRLHVLSMENMSQARWIHDFEGDPFQWSIEFPKRGEGVSDPLSDRND